MNLKSQQVIKDATAKHSQAAPQVRNRVRGFAGNHALIRKQRLLNVPEHHSVGAIYRPARDEERSQLPRIQKKSLGANISNGAYEKEADEIARTIVQRRSERGGTAHTINGNGEGFVQPPPEFQSKLKSSKGRGHSLDVSTRSEMESKMGVDFGTVRVHTGSEANAMSESLNAKAFTHGQDVFFNKGEYKPDSRRGQELIAHELVHTRQQKNAFGFKVQRQAKVDPGKEIVHQKVGFGGAGNMGPNTGEVSVRTGDTYSFREQKESNLISFTYAGAVADQSRWLQFVSFEMHAYTPRGVVYNEGSAPTTAGFLPYTTDPQNPRWAIDTGDKSNPFYEAKNVNTRSADATTILDRPGGASWHPEINRFVANKAQDLAFGSLVASFDTFLIQNNRANYHIKWWAITSFVKEISLRPEKKSLYRPEKKSWYRPEKKALSESSSLANPPPKVRIDGDAEVEYGTGASENIGGLPADRKKVLHENYPKYKAIE